MASARPLRIVLLVLMIFLGFVALAVVLKSVSEEMGDVFLRALKDGAIVPGVPLLAILLSEMPIRDGIRQQTLLYPLLGPVPRRVTAVVRTAATAVLLAVGVTFVMVLLQVLQGESLGSLGGELLGVWLGSAAYIALFGAIHLVLRRGLIGGLVIFSLDFALSYVPFSLRNLSPCYHLRVLADQLVEMDLPIPIATPPSSLLTSSIILAVTAVVLSGVGGFLFSRKNLGDLC
jgi:hypothetical protein